MQNLIRFRYIIFAIAVLCMSYYTHHAMNKKIDKLNKKIEDQNVIIEYMHSRMDNTFDEFRDWYNNLSKRINKQ